VVLLLLLALACSVQAKCGGRKVDITGKITCATHNGKHIPIEDATIELYEDDKPFSTLMSKAVSTGGVFKLHGEDWEFFDVKFFLTITVPCSKASKSRQNCVHPAYHRM
ncbi:hypothetical protein PENTCL1PPCAC_21949, partial [Pristionchus entomophagus]